MTISYDLYTMMVQVLMPFVSMLWCDLPVDLTQLAAFKGISLDTIIHVYLAHPVRRKYVQPQPNVVITAETVTIVLNAIPYEAWTNRKQIPHGNKHTVILEMPDNLPQYRLYRNVQNFVSDSMFSLHAQFFALKARGLVYIPILPGKVAQYAYAKFPGQIRHIKGALENPINPIICVNSMTKAQYSSALYSYGRHVPGTQRDEFPMVFVEAQRKWGRYGYMKLGGVEFNNAYFRSLVPFAKPVSVYGEDPELLGADAEAAGYGFEILTRSSETIDILSYYRDTGDSDAAADKDRDTLLDSIDVLQVGTRYVRALNIPRLLAAIEAQGNFDRIITADQTEDEILAQDEQDIIALCRKVGYNYIDTNDKLHFVDVAGQPAEEPVTVVHQSK